MSRCPICNGWTPQGICFHHTSMEDNWAVANRIMCDFLHRKIPPPLITLESWLSNDPHRYCCRCGCGGCGVECTA